MPFWDLSIAHYKDGGGKELETRIPHLLSPSFSCPSVFSVPTEEHTGSESPVLQLSIFLSEFETQRVMDDAPPALLPADANLPPELPEPSTYMLHKSRPVRYWLGAQLSIQRWPYL